MAGEGSGGRGRATAAESPEANRARPRQQHNSASEARPRQDGAGGKAPERRQREEQRRSHRASAIDLAVTILAQGRAGLSRSPSPRSIGAARTCAATPLEGGSGICRARGPPVSAGESEADPGAAGCAAVPGGAARGARAPLIPRAAASPHARHQGRGKGAGRAHEGEPGDWPFSVSGLLCRLMRKLRLPTLRRPFQEWSTRLRT